MKTWSQVRKVIFLRARCDYILGTDQNQFEIEVIRDVRNYPPDNFTLWDRLYSDQYGVTISTSRDAYLPPPAPEDYRHADRKFEEVKALEPTPPPLTRPPRPR